MSRAIKRRRQETFNIDGHKITVVIKSRSSVGNFTGYAADVSDNRGNHLNIPVINRLFYIEAQEIAYMKFIQKFF